MLVKLINEEINKHLNEEDVWYHGTPDERDLKQTGSFTNRTNTTDYISDPNQWHELQKQMGDARSSGNEDQYFELLDQAGKLRKSLTYNKPIYFTNNRSVANTYADEKRAFDYQNSIPSILKVEIDDSGKVLEVPAYGERFRGIKADIVRKALLDNGISNEVIDKYFNMFTTNIRDGNMTSETLGIIAQQIGFDIIDVLGVLDSYHGGNTKSKVRMVFNPSKVKII